MSDGHGRRKLHRWSFGGPAGKQSQRSPATGAGAHEYDTGRDLDLGILAGGFAAFRRGPLLLGSRLRPGVPEGGSEHRG